MKSRGLFVGDHIEIVFAGRCDSCSRRWVLGRVLAFVGCLGVLIILSIWSIASFKVLGREVEHTIDALSRGEADADDLLEHRPAHSNGFGSDPHSLR